MSQIEQEIRKIFGKQPEIEKCVQHGLINRRALARYLINQGAAKTNELEAVIATLRRLETVRYPKDTVSLFSKIQVRVRDNIHILDFEKDKGVVRELKRIIETVNYDQGDTLKIVIGSNSIKIFIDEKKKNEVKELTKQFNLLNEYTEISEISIIFPKEAMETRGIISFITREFMVHDLVILECLTASPELLVYMHDSDVVKAYDLIKQIKSQ